MEAVTVGESIAAAVHRQAMTAPIRELARHLQEILSRRLTAYIVGVQDGKTVSRWANGEISEIRDHETERRLRVTYEISTLLLTRDSPQTVKAWFIGLNPQLGDSSPAEAIHEGNLKQALRAARAFSIGG
jgi:hypothetical protein